MAASRLVVAGRLTDLDDAPLDESLPLPLPLMPTGGLAGSLLARATTFSFFFIAPLITSPLVRKADASGRRRTGRRLASLERALLFFRGLFFFSIDIHQGNHRPVNFVIGGAVRSHPKRVLPAFVIGDFLLAGVERFDHI